MVFLFDDLPAQTYGYFRKFESLTGLRFVEQFPRSAPICLVAVVALRVDLRAQKRSTLGDFPDLFPLPPAEKIPFSGHLEVLQQGCESCLQDQ